MRMRRRAVWNGGEAPPYTSFAERVRASVFPNHHAAREGRPRSRSVLSLLLRFLRCLGELLNDALALELRNVVDEQHAVDVIDFVLNAGGEQAFGVFFVPLAFKVEVSDFGSCRPLDVLMDVRDRQAALFVQRFLFG